MSDRLQRVGEGLLGGMAEARAAMWAGGLTSWLIATALWVPIVGMTIGAMCISADRGAPVLPSHATYVWQMLSLVVMFVALWASRLQNRAASLGATLAFCLAGLSFTALEARTGAAFDLGVWPTWSGSSLLWGIAPFLHNWWSSPTAWVITLWFTALLPMLGSALCGEPVRALAPIPSDAHEDAEHRAGQEQVSTLVVKPKRKLQHLAGMPALKEQLREFGANFTHYRQRNARPSEINGLLLGGPPGNGKTAFAEALAGELGFGFLRLGVKELSSKWVNESAQKIGAAVAAAVTHAPCVLFLDEIDAIASDRGDSHSSHHHEDIKAVNALLQEIDTLRSQRVVLVAASNHVDRLDPAVVRPGRFDVKIEIPLPDMEAREGILSALLDKAGLEVEPGVVTSVAALWERRSAAFIESTVKKLSESAKRAGPTRALRAEDLKAASRAASRREGNIPKTGTPLSKLILPASVRREAASIVYRLKNWEQLALRGGTPPTGVLLYGPPGTGKTNLVRAMALELGDWHVFEVKVAQMLADPRVFDKVLEQASEHRPAFVFLDEADDLLRDRSYSNHATATNEILKAMDGTMGAVPEVVFIAATNNPDAIDAAAKRGGRFGEKVLVDLFEGEDLMALASSEMQRRTTTLFASDVTPAWLASAFGPIGPADFIAVLNKAVNASLTTDEARAITREDLMAASTSVIDRLAAA